MNDVISPPREVIKLMRIDVGALLEQESGIMDFAVDGKLDEFVTNGDSWKLPWSVHVEGTISNSDGILNMKGIITGAILLRCDRCLETFVWPLFIKLEEEFAHTAVSDGDVLNIYDGNYLDIDSIIYNDIVLEIPMKSLCTLECKGLCQKCGANLNYQRCECECENADIRLAGLSNWFDKNGGER
jgi:uncharacterized protein